MTETEIHSSERKRAVFAALLAVFLMAGSLSLSPASSSASSSAGERLVKVIVQTTTGSVATAVDAVEAVGGTVTRELSIIGGVSAKISSVKLEALRTVPGILDVSPDEKIAFQGKGKKGKDYNKPKRIQQVVNSDSLWAEGVTGAGVTVAVLDTGIYAAHPDLQGANGSRVVVCEDLSHEAGTVAECADTFGHGTFMAGLVAGNGASSNGKYSGVAPEANLASIKVAGFDGSTDISTILAGIQWAVAHQSMYNIKILNLSLGSDSAQDYRLSPLNFAVERAWDAGVTVVVSSGNSGPDGMTVMKPGDDPFVITVGASDDQGTLKVNDDLVPVFSSRGPTKANGFAKPDVVSPGVHTISLRSPGSAIDQKFGADAAVDDNYFRGTGTSMSTATVSGMVAQILQANPSLTPNQVKYRVISTARTIAELNPLNAGAGIIDAYAAARSGATASANQGIDRSTGLGLLALDRGTLGLTLQVVTPAGQIDMQGEFAAQINPENISLQNPGGLVPWVASSWKADGWDASSWKASSWKTEDWAASSWKASSWKGTEWEASSWKGTEWDNVDWDASSWKVDDWEASSWKASSWKSAWYAAAWD